MRRARAVIEFILDDSFGASDDEGMWLENEVLVGDGNLILHSNDLGDTVGIIKSVKNIQYLSNNDAMKTER